MRKKYIAELTRWDGVKEIRTIKKSWAEEIAWAVKGQWFFQDFKRGYSINGAKYSDVDIYEVIA